MDEKKFKISERNLKTILLVEDTPQEMRRGQELLTNEGYKVPVADNFCDASRILAEVRPSGVLTDLFIFHDKGRPDPDFAGGLLVVAQCVQQHIPVVVCSSESSHGNKAMLPSMLCSLMDWEFVGGMAEDGGKDWNFALLLLKRKVGDEPPLPGDE